MDARRDRDHDPVEERAVMARSLLRELAANALPVLKTKSRGKALEAYLKRRFLSRLLRASRGGYRILSPSNPLSAALNPHRLYPPVNANRGSRTGKLKR